MTSFTPMQQVIVAITPKITSFLSATGSSCIIAECCLLDRRKLGRVYNRLLLAMSMTDVVESAFNFASSWPIPRGTPGVAFAVGTTQTCTAQGFVLQFGLAIPILNASLALYYLLFLRYSWSEEQIRSRAEPWFYVAAFSVALGTSFASLFLDLFNNSNLWCWIAPYPLDCYDQGNCIRGENAWIYRWVFYYVELWSCILFVMFAMIAVYATVHRLEEANNRYLISHHRISRRNAATLAKKKRQKCRRSSIPSKSHQVAIQALWYVGAFYATFLFSTINRILQQAVGKTYFPITVLHAWFDPSQGFLNYIVYVRPRYLRYRYSHPDASCWKALRSIYSTSRATTTTKDDAGDEGGAVSRLGAGKFMSNGSSAYTGEDHEDEEEARRELTRWRRTIVSRSRASGLLRLVSSLTRSFGLGSSTEVALRRGTIVRTSAVRDCGDWMVESSSDGKETDDEEGCIDEMALAEERRGSDLPYEIRRLSKMEISDILRSLSPPWRHSSQSDEESTTSPVFESDSSSVGCEDGLTSDATDADNHALQHHPTPLEDDECCTPGSGVVDDESASFNSTARLDQSNRMGHLRDGKESDSEFDDAVPKKAVSFHPDLLKDMIDAYSSPTSTDASKQTTP